MSATQRNLMLTAWAAVLGAFLYSLTGCGGADNVGRVSGTVTLNGEPLEGALVEFEPVEGNSPAKGITDASGQYSLRYSREVLGAEVGQHRVRITTASGGDPDAEPPKPAVKEKLPPNYHRDTTLTAEVSSGSNVIDFPLESKSSGAKPKR